MTRLIFNKIKTSMRNAALNADRAPNEIQLLAVSKKKSINAIHDVYAMGQRDFGENYLQEAIKKQAVFHHENICQDIRWHFIGPIQSNKTRAISESFAWVHSVDRLKIAQRLNDQRPRNLGTLQICLQVNIDSEQSKSGVSPEDTLELAKALLSLENISLRGLMVIPSKNDINDAFSRTQTLFKEIKSGLSIDQQQHFDTLSMGMSSDYQEAINHGSTMIRIGTLLFGERG